jgi:hypothetical protein
MGLASSKGFNPNTKILEGLRLNIQKIKANSSLSCMNVKSIQKVVKVDILSFKIFWIIFRKTKWQIDFIFLSRNNGEKLINQAKVRRTWRFHKKPIFGNLLNSLVNLDEKYLEKHSPRPALLNQKIFKETLELKKLKKTILVTYLQIKIVQNPWKMHRLLFGKFSHLWKKS